jgi:hypothetical protein
VTVNANPPEIVKLNFPFWYPSRSLNGRLLGSFPLTVIAPNGSICSSTIRGLAGYRKFHESLVQITFVFNRIVRRRVRSTHRLRPAQVRRGALVALALSDRSAGSAGKAQPKAGAEGHAADNALRAEPIFAASEAVPLPVQSGAKDHLSIR